MAWKYRRWRIKWNRKGRKFTKKKVNRKRSKQASLRWRRNRGKMLRGLRKARRKGKRTMRRNKAAGLYRKLKTARKKYKSILRHDVDMSMFIDSMLNEDSIDIPELEIDSSVDLESMTAALKDMSDDLDFEDDIRKHAADFVRDAKKVLKSLKDVDPEDYTQEEIEQIHDILDIIDDYNDLTGYYDNDQEGEYYDDYDDDDDLDDTDGDDSNDPYGDYNDDDEYDDFGDNNSIFNNTEDEE